ncbi:MAG: PaaI family thioesterase [Chloroflexi bacterium]|nr:PaaI family thioesterase [Chloroflexota bacterium]
MTSTPDWSTTPFFRQFGVRVEETREGYARLSIPREAVRLRGARDSINGGLVAVLGNAAMQVCLHTLMGPGERAGRTHELTVAFLDSARGEVTSIEARVLRKGGRIVVGEVELRDTADGALNAKLRVTCEVVRVATPEPR